MKIVGIYSFNGGLEIARSNFEAELTEIEQIVARIDATKYKTKKSKEKTMPGRTLYSPKLLNKAIDSEFMALDWRRQRVFCDYPTQFYVGGYESHKASKGAFREMDFIKNTLGVEVQFGKYSFMVYNVCAKMTIFRNLGFIKAGVEIVPVKELAEEMSSGVSYFEQFVWDLEKRGVSDIDVPVLILGVAL